MRLLALLAAVAACTPPPKPPPPADAGITHVTGLANNHVTTCTDPSMCGSGAEPPVGGPHCGSTIPCRVHATAQNRCEYLHNMEHGHMVLAYNCPMGCDEIVQGLRDFQAGSPRSLVTPDPKLTTKVAAMVWGWSWSGDVVDVAKLELVRAQQDVDAPEPGLGCLP